MPSASSARASSFARLSSPSGWKISTRARDSSAALSSKDGFSVVAPTSDHRAVFHDRQEAVLLGAVEAMDLVDEQQRLAAVGAAQLARRLEHLLQVGDAGKHRRYLLEGEARSRRRAAARPWFCRCRAVPRKSSSRANPSDQPRQRAVARRSDAPGRRPRQGSSGAAGRRAAGGGAFRFIAPNRSAMILQVGSRSSKRSGTGLR